MKSVLAAAIFTALIITTPVASDTGLRHTLMPAPAEISFGGGALVIDGSFSISFDGYREPRLERAASRLLERVSAQAGIIFIPAYDGIDGAGTVLSIRVDKAGEAVQSLHEDESYRLVIDGGGARLSSATPVGALRGIETFLQLIEPGPRGFAVPFVTIKDEPRFRWRGLLVDSCRHWLPPGVIHRTLDAMAAVKLNVLHWHLSEDQGFRVESKLFPKLQLKGSDGNYYTQEEIRAVVSHARDLGIRVVPEFDMPGHASAWLVGYPELGSAPGPYHIARRWGVFPPVLDPTREEVYAFLDKFIGEMTGLFPDEYFHIGGDEVVDDHWRANPRIQEFMVRRGIADSHALQTYFNGRVLKILQRHGKKMIGWDEIFHPELPHDIVVQSWRGRESLADGARKGYLGILSNGYYIDLFFHAADHYTVDPLGGPAAALSEEEKARILGGEACMWGELITPELIDSRIWPRTAAVAERFWSPAEITDVDDMYRRLEIQSRRLESLGLNHRAFTRVFLERLAGPGGSIEHLRILAAALEPVKDYTRHRTRDYTSHTPLNRLVDAIPSDSPFARRFNMSVERMLASREGWDLHKTEVTDLLAGLKANHAGLLPLLKSRAVLREIVPLSETVSRLAAAALEAIDSISAGIKPDDDWVGEVDGLLLAAEADKQPQHEVQIAILPVIKALVDRAGVQ